MLKEAVLEAYTAGGEPTVLLVSPANKQVVSTFPGIAEQRFKLLQQVKLKLLAQPTYTCQTSVTLSVVPDRFLSDEVSYVLDPSMAVSYLRPFKSN